MTGSSIPPTANDPHFEQAETRISVQTFDTGATIVDVVYNDFTGKYAGNAPPPAGFVTYNANGDSSWYPGFSVLGYSVSTNAGTSFTYQPIPKLRPPNYGQPGGWDLLRGDPSIIHSPYNQNYVYMANLASSHTAVQSVGGVSVNGNAPIDGACIARSTDAGQTFQLALGDCFYGSPGASYDGSDIVGDLNGNIYAAFVDLNAQRFDVWEATGLTAPFTLLPPPPFPTGPGSHPRVRFDSQTGNVYLMALAGPGTPLDDGNETIGLWATFWNGSVWAPSVQVSSHVLAGVPVPRGPVLGQLAPIHTSTTQFSFAVGTPDCINNDDIRIVYTSEEATPGSPHLVTYVCRRDLSFCAGPIPGWGTQSSAGIQYNPQVAAEPAFLSAPAASSVSYNSTQFAADPNTGTTLSFMSAPLNVNTSPCQALPWRPRVLEYSVPICPTLPYSLGGTEYWGDYDDLTVLSVSYSGVTTFIRSHTDSTSQCTYRDKHWATPMHVSADTYQ